VLADAHVVHHDVVVAAAGGELSAVPREGADARLVAAQGSHLLAGAYTRPFLSST